MSLYPTMSTLCLALFLARCRASWIDIETPLNKRSTVSFVDGSTYELVGAGEGSVETLRPLVSSSSPHHSRFFLPFSTTIPGNVRRV